MQDKIIFIIGLSVLFYLLGSIPTAYIFLRLLYKKDITNEGSGNVGAMNSYEVTGSKKIGIIVFVFDFLKGLIPTSVLLLYLRLDFQFAFIPLIALVAGHNFSLWLKFKGGRGLSTSAGILIVIYFWSIFIWCGIYLLSNFVKKNVHIGNSIATILLPFMLLFLNSQGLSFSQYFVISNEIINIFVSIICFLVLLKHINPILSIIRKSK